MGKLMQLTVINIIENEDGSADVELKMDEETKNYLINYAVIDILSTRLNDIDKLHEKGIQVEFSD